MIHSFRLRLALLSAILSGLALGVFGWTTWWFIRDIRIDRLTQEVREQAEREVRKTRTLDDWRRIETKLVSSLGVRDGSDLLLLVIDGEGNIAYCSNHWPPRLVATELPWPHPKTKGREKAGGLIGLLDAHAADSEAKNAETARPQPLEPKPPGPPPASSNLTREVDGHVWMIGLATSGGSRVAVGVDERVIDADMTGVRNAFLLALPLALLMIGFGAWAFSDRAMQPVKKLTAATHRMSAEKLDQRIPLQGEDREFSDLIEVFNSMLERLERSFNQAHRFSADAAHELKTPLAILQGQLERAIGMVEPGSPVQSEMSSILDEVRRLSTISRKLLLLSQADAGRLNIHREPFDLSKALSELAEDIHLLDPELGVTSTIPPGIMIQADSGLFPQVLHNLISNAIKYNIEKGWIDISVAKVTTGIEVNIANPSPSIPLVEQGRLFERFFRADLAHGRNIEGVGLGLSVSREIARAHGGDISFKAEADGTVRFSLRLPAV